MSIVLISAQRGIIGGSKRGGGGEVGGFACVKIKIYLIPHKVLQHSYGPPSMAVSKQQVFSSPPILLC